MEIIRKATPQAPKIMIYGTSGVGKTTLSSKLKNPLLIDFEGGANYLDIPRTPQITNVEVFYKILAELYHAKEHEFDTIVIDSADWLVRKVTEAAAEIDKDNLDKTLNKSNGGYGNGKQVLENHIRTKLLPMLVTLNKAGYAICLIAHADRKTIMSPDGFDIEQIAPKIDSNTMNAFVEWCDNVFYLKKGSDGVRKLLVEDDGVALAKNRLSLVGEYDIDNIDINELLIGKVKENK